MASTRRQQTDASRPWIAPFATLLCCLDLPKLPQPRPQSDWAPPAGAAGAAPEARADLIPAELENAADSASVSNTVTNLCNNSAVRPFGERFMNSLRKFGRFSAKRNNRGVNFPDLCAASSILRTPAPSGWRGAPNGRAAPGRPTDPRYATSDPAPQAPPRDHPPRFGSCFPPAWRAPRARTPARFAAPATGPAALDGPTAPDPPEGEWSLPSRRTVRATGGREQPLPPHA